MFFKDFVSVKRKKIKKGASQTYDTPSFFVYSLAPAYLTFAAQPTTLHSISYAPYTLKH